MKNRRNLVLILSFLKVRAFTCDGEIYDKRCMRGRGKTVLFGRNTPLRGSGDDLCAGVGMLSLSIPGGARSLASAIGQGGGSAWRDTRNHWLNSGCRGDKVDYWHWRTAHQSSAHLQRGRNGFYDHTIFKKSPLQSLLIIKSPS